MGKRGTKPKYTDEQLVEMLKEKAEAMGRPPTIKELDNDCSMPKYGVYRNHFGSYGKVLELAELTPSQKHYTDDEMADALKRKAEELGRTPNTREMANDKSMPGATTYIARFGTWNKALEAAGLEINVMHCDYTNKELIKKLKDKAKELGRTPSSREMAKEEKSINRSVYRQRFGSWNNALKLAGLETNVVHAHYTDEELLDLLKEKAEELGRTPTSLEMNKDEGMPNAEVYITRFDSWNTAIEAAGLSTKRQRYTDEELIWHLQSKAFELGRTPEKREIEGDREMPSVSTFTKQLGGGSFNKAIEAAGMEPANPMVRYTKKELLKLLKKKAEELGRTPTTKELDTNPDMPNGLIYYNHFGSYGKALENAGLEPNKKAVVKKRPLKKKLLDERL